MKFRTHFRNKNLIFLLSALFCVLFGAKIMVISSYGNVVPISDQWDGEAALVYLPYMDGTLSIKSLFGAHNEHRIFFTRMLSLNLLLVSGEWNPILQMLVNAPLHATAVVLLTSGLIRGMSEDERLPLILLSATVFALPIGYENLLGGFQSQFYFLLLFATSSFILIIRSPPLSLGWWGALFAAVASYFSLASGALTFFIVTSVVVGQNVTKNKYKTRDWLSVPIFLAGGIVCLMFLTMPAGHIPLKAHSLSEFLTAFVWLAGFPFTTVAGTDRSFAVQCLFVLFALSPSLALALRILGGREVSETAWLAAAILLFVVLQILLVSYSRAQGFNAPRYLDIILFGIPASFAALSLVVATRFTRSLWAFATVASVIYFALSTSFPQLAAQKQAADQQLKNVKAFLAASDISTLQHKPFTHIPYPDAARLASLLSSPLLRMMLPEELRPTDQVTQELREKFFPHTTLYRLVFKAKNWLLRSGNWIFAIGISILFVELLWRKTTTPLMSDNEAPS